MRTASERASEQVKLYFSLASWRRWILIEGFKQLNCNAWKFIKSGHIVHGHSHRYDGGNLWVTNNSNYISIPNHSNQQNNEWKKTKLIQSNWLRSFVLGLGSVFSLSHFIPFFSYSIFLPCNGVCLYVFQAKLKHRCKLGEQLIAECGVVYSRRRVCKNSAQTLCAHKYFVCVCMCECVRKLTQSQWRLCIARSMPWLRALIEYYIHMRKERMNERTNRPTDRPTDVYMWYWYWFNFLNCFLLLLESNALPTICLLVIL